MALLQMQYLQRVRELVDDIEATSAAQTDAAAEAIANALVAGNDFYISPLGHGLSGDLLHRAGGLAAAQPFTFSFGVNDGARGAARGRERPEPFDADTEAARLAVRSSRMREGDCIIVGSVSGRSVRPVSLAIAARETSATVIGVTSLEYSSRTAPIHPSGKRLSEVCDIVIDIRVPYGDAALVVEGLPEAVIPLSGVGTLIVGWMICAQVGEKLLARGLEPSFYMSGNRPEGQEYNKRVQEQFNRQGY